MNGIHDGIMRKAQINVKLIDRETQRNQWISKVRYKIEQYFGLSSLHQWAGTAHFTTLVKEGWDRILGIVAFNLKRVVLKTRRLAAAA